MGQFDADFADLLPKDSGVDFSRDFQDLVPKDTGADFSKDFVDLLPKPPPDYRAQPEGILEEHVGAPLARGVEGLKREAAMFSLLKGAKVLEDYQAIDKGDMTVLTDPLGGQRAKFYFTRQKPDREALTATAQADLTKAIIDVVERTKALQAMPQDQEIERALQAETMEEFWNAFKQKPLKFIGNVGIESLAQMAPGIAMAIPAGLIAGPAGAAAAIGAGSGIVDFSASAMEALMRRGVDLSNEAAVRKAVADPALLEEVKLVAFKHAAPVALFDAASMGALTRRLGANFVSNALKQLGAQATLGAGGEATGQLAAGEGIQVGQIAAEAAGELAQAPFEAVVAAVTPAVTQASTKAQAKRELRAIEREIEAVDVTQGTEQVAIEALKPERAQLVAVPREAAAAPQQAAPVETPTPTVEIPTPSEAAHVAPGATQIEEVSEPRSVEPVPATALDEFAVRAGEEIGGISHLRPVVETLQRVYINQGVEAGRAVLEDMAASAPESSGFSQEVATPGFLDELHEQLSRRARDFKAMEFAPTEGQTEAELQARDAALVQRGPAVEETPAAPETDLLAAGPQLTPAAERSWEEIRDRVAELARQITPTANVRTIRSVWSGETQARGRYNKPYKFIEISLTQGEQETTFKHEAVHALKDMGLFTPQEWRMLEREASKTWRREFDIDSRYAGRKLTNEQLLEEAIASAYGEYRSGYLTAAPQLVRVMRKIKDFFERLGNLLRSMGFRSIDDVFESIEAGEVGRRKPGQGPWTSPDGVLYALGPNVNNPPTPAARNNYVVSASRALRQKMASPPANSWEADAGLLKRLFVTPRTIAAFEPDFVPVYQTAIDQWKFRDQLIAKFEREADAYFKASPEDQAVVNRVLEHDRLTGQVGLAGQNKTVHFTSPAAQLSKAGERLTVTDEQKTAYWAVRSMLNMALDEFKAQTLEDFGLLANTAPAAIAQMIAKAASKADAAKLQHVADILQGIEDARRTGYVPFTRYGEIGISVRHPLTKDLLHYETIEPGFWQRRGGKPLVQMPEVRDRLVALRKQYPGMAISEPFQVPKSGMPTQVKLEEVDALAEMAKIDNATWDSVRAKLEQAVASQGFRAHFFRAKNTPGYSPDFERSLANYVNGISGYLARRRHARRWTAAIAPISLNKPKLHQYAQDYQKYVNSPAEEFGALRGVNFVYYLTSVASWIVNLTQVPFVSVPWSTQFASPAAASAAFVRAEAETAAMLTLKQGTQMYSATKAPADVRAAVQQAYDQGLFIPITTYESMGIARNQGRRLRKLSKAAQTAVEIFGLGFTTAERQNRISTFIALYRLARDNSAVRGNFARVMAGNAMARPVIQNWSPQAFAEFGIDETHFKAGKVNRPTLARNAGTLVFQFKMFTWNMIERLITMSVLQGPEGRASAALIVYVIGLVSGIWGLPGAEDLRDLTELFMRKVKKHDVNLDAEMRKIIVDLLGSATLAEAVSGGAPRALPEPWNIDLSKRIGLGNIVPQTPGDALGVSYDLWIKRPMQAMEQYETDNLMLALAELSPKQAADIMTQLAWAEAGVRSRTTDQPILPKERITPGMRAAKAVGFTPGTIANIREGERAEQVAIRAANEKRNDFYRRMAKTVADEVRAEEANDAVALAAATQREEKLWAEIEAWNEAKPDYLQIYLDRRSARKNLIKEFEGADYDRGARRQARDEIERLRRVYGR